MVMISILIVLIFIIVIIIFNYKPENTDVNNTDYTTPDTVVSKTIEPTVQKVKDRNNFYVVKNCITRFFTYYTAIYEEDTNEEYIEENTQKQNAIAVYNMLDTEYIRENNLTEENILTKLEVLNQLTIDINSMLVSQRSVNLSVYIVEGTLRENSSGKISPFKIMVKIDANNNTFSILLQDYVDRYYPNIIIGNNFNITVADNIQENPYNKYSYKDITDEEYIKELLEKYREEALFNLELAYNNLEEEYRQKRFNDLEDFKKYVKDNSKKYVMMEASAYNKSVTDTYTQYVCVDQYNNYYVFRENAIMDYSLILDTYTLDLPEFIEQYNKSNSMEKVGFNIQKCIEAINHKDYSYVYNKLDETFKQNTYKTEEDFEKYIKNNLYETNVAGKVSSLNEGNTYIYNINICDKENNTKNKEVTFIMELKQGTDFVMSFSIE